MIQILSTGEQAALRESGRILGSVMRDLIAMVKPGLRILDLEEAAATLIQERGAIPAFKGYRGYKDILCVSVNEEVVHCPPTARLLEDGDIVSIDNGVIVDGLYSDCAVTVAVGNISQEARHLINTTRDALEVEAVKMMGPNHTTGDIGHAIQRFVEQEKLAVVRALVGHGIGRQLHQDPSIPNYGKPGRGAQLVPGMAIAVEPMVNLGKSDVEFMDDGWRVITVDGSLSAHFEHTFLITPTGYELITTI